MLRPSRDSDRPVRYLQWRIRLFGTGAILALFGIGADIELLRWAALVVLGGAAALSVMASRGEEVGTHRGGMDAPGEGVEGHGEGGDER